MKIEPYNVQRIREIVLEWVDDVANGIADENDPRAVWVMTWVIAYARWRALRLGESIDDCQSDVLDEIGWPKDGR